MQEGQRLIAEKVDDNEGDFLGFGTGSLHLRVQLFLARIVSRIDEVDTARAHELNLQDRFLIPGPDVMGWFAGSTNKEPGFSISPFGLLGAIETVLQRYYKPVL